MICNEGSIFNIHAHIILLLLCSLVARKESPGFQSKLLVYISVFCCVKGKYSAYWDLRDSFKAESGGIARPNEKGVKGAFTI